MLPDDPEVLQMLHEIVEEGDGTDERSLQADAAWLQRSKADATAA